MSGAENALDFEHASKKQRAEADGKTVGATESETRDAIGCTLQLARGVFIPDGEKTF